MNVVNHPKVAVLRLTVLASVCVAYLFSQASNAQEQSAFQQPSAANPVQWISGPRKVALGDTAEITIPEGYRFLDDKGGRSFLEGMRNSAPKNLIGILAPDSTKWFAVIEYSGTGYVKDTDASQLDASAMLKKVQKLIARQNAANSTNSSPAIASADWELKPVYNPAQNKLEWAIRAANVVNYSVRLLGRRGVLEVVAVQPYQTDFDLVPLRDIVNGIFFKDGERYSDYKLGDTLAKASMAQLAANENGPNAASASNNKAKSSHNVLWIVGAGSAVLLLAGAGLMVKKLSKGSRSQDTGRQSTKAAQSITAAAPRQPVSTNQGQPSTLLAVPAASSTVQSAVPAGVSPAPVAKGQALVSLRGVSERNGKTSKHNGRRRKKQYNFHLFYSDMIMNLTRWNYMGGFGSYTSDYAHGLNGSALGESSDDSKGTANNGHNGNGNGNGANGNHNSSATNTNAALPLDAAKLLAIETSKLIENQQKLIEGQRKLIDEQNKLIQEKSKLIDFESTVLAKQSEMIADQELM